MSDFTVVVNHLSLCNYFQFEVDVIQMTASAWLDDYRYFSFVYEENVYMN